MHTRGFEEIMLGAIEKPECILKAKCILKSYQEKEVLFSVKC